MPELPRTRDSYTLSKGDTFTVTITDRMAVGGWKGGQGVQYTSSAKDEVTVDYSDGLYAGFMLWGSDESSDKFTAMTQNQPAYKFVVVGAGGWVIMTTTYEKYTYASRMAGPPYVPIEYHASDRMVFSLRGYWTNEDEWTLSGDPRGANNYYIGFLIQRPTPARNEYMTLQVSI